VFLGRRPVDDRVDALGTGPQRDGEVDVPVAERVHKGVDRPSRRRPDVLGHPVAPGIPDKRNREFVSSVDRP
jgi:hypothetical protein